MPLTVPNNAPFTGAQRMWLKGFLDGINNVLDAPGLDTPGEVAGQTPASNGVSVTILWGSQTGNSESLAKKLAKQLGSHGHTATIADMANASMDQLATIGHLLVITSTYGDGEPPDNASTLHTDLHADNAPSLAAVKFSVLALGDSNYASFCKCGHDFDQQLAALGATRLTPLVECDVDFDEPFAAWTEQLLCALTPA